MAKFFEVLFRGASESQLQVWWPEGGKSKCSAMEARQRHDELLEAAQAGERIDGVVPVVVEIRQVKTVVKKLATVDGNGIMSEKAHRDVTRINSMLVTTVDGPNDFSQVGPWAS